MGKRALKQQPKSQRAAKAPSPKRGSARVIKVRATAGSTVTNAALLEAIADYLGITRSQAKVLTRGYLEVIKAYLAEGASVKFGDIGTIAIRHRKARMGRNPQTGQTIKIRASKKLSFRQSKVMAAQVASLRGPHGVGEDD